MNILNLFSRFDKEMKFRGWQQVTESENSGYSAYFSSEKEITACMYDRYNSGSRYSFSLWNIGERYRARIIRNGGMIILPYENLTNKEESRIIGKIIAYLRQRIAPINKSLCHKNMIIEILRRRNEIKCFSLGHYFSGVYISKESGTEYNSGSLCIEIFNSARMTLYRIAEDFCAAMDKPEILLKDCRDGKIRRFER